MPIPFLRMHPCPTCGHARTAVAPIASVAPIEPRALKLLARQLDGCDAGLWHILTLLYTRERAIIYCRELAQAIGMHPLTFASRMSREGVPIRELVLWCVMVRAASILEDPRVSIGMAALEVGYSSAGSFGVAVQTFGRFGRTATELRATWTGVSAFRAFQDQFVFPHHSSLMSLRLPVRSVA